MMSALRDSALRSAVLKLLSERDPGKTICPSEAARHAFPDGWRDHMEATRQVAISMATEGLIDICQRGRVIDLAREIKGPVRLCLR